MSFPVDPTTLNLIYDAITGEELKLTHVLNFLSGYNSDNVIDYGDHVEYQGTVYSRDDVISALILEIRRLRGN